MHNFVIRKLLATIIGLVIFVGIIPVNLVFAEGTIDTRGVEFYLSAPDNLVLPSLFLYISSETAANVNILIPSQSVDEDIMVDANSVYTYDLPEAIELDGTGVSDASIYVTSDVEISVYFVNIGEASSDAYVGLPVDALGTSYYLVGYQGAGDGYVAITATEDGTDVEIFNVAGVSQVAETIDAGEIYYYENAVTDDLSGFRVEASAPVSVVAGNTCGNVPLGFSACDFIAEMIPPIDSLGTAFYSFPLGGRLNGDTFVAVVTEDDTIITIDGTITSINRAANSASTYTTPDALDAGAKLEFILTSGAEITSNKPILIAHFSNGTTFDSQTGDPFMNILPPFEQYLGSYNVTTPAMGFSANYITLIAKTSDLDNLEVNGELVDAENFTQIGDSNYSGDSIVVDAGSYSVTGSTPFGIEVYGFNGANSYGYPGGYGVASIASVNSVTLGESDGCEDVGVIATVLNTDEAPVIGARVDFIVNGDTETSGFAFTDELGKAEFCYDSLGIDTVIANVGAIESNELELGSVSNYAPNIPNNLGATEFVNGSQTTTANPTFTFVLSDSNDNDQVKFMIQVDDAANFYTPLIDYTSSLGAQGSRTFTVGQAAGDGVYNVGAQGQSLSIGSYYWRVKAIDDSAAESSYSVARDGEIAFVVVEQTPNSGESSLLHFIFSNKLNDDVNNTGINGAENFVESFDDLNYLDANDWRLIAINRLMDLKLFDGKKSSDGKNNFDYQGVLTRAEAAKITCVLVECLKNGSLKGDFYDDVKENDWYFTYVIALSNVGVLQGRAAREYMPEDVVTRAELVKMLVLALAVGDNKNFSETWESFKLNKFSNYETRFVDVEFKVNAWFKSFIYYMEELSYLNGYIIDDQQYFLPDKLITRGEAAALIVKVLGR